MAWVLYAASSKKRGGMTEQRGVFRRNGLGQCSVPLGEGAIPNAFSASIQIGDQMQKHGADRFPRSQGESNAARRSIALRRRASNRMNGRKGNVSRAKIRIVSTAIFR